MQRRAFLAATGTVAVGLAGCLGLSGGADGAEWSHDVGGWVDTVADGRLLFREEWGNDTDGDGSVTALDAESGEHLWSYGSVQGYSKYTDLTVDGGVYFGLGDDAIGSGSGELYALDLDGTERWTGDTGSVYERPRHVDGVLYAGSDDGVVRAFDADDGEVLWRHEVEADESGPPDPQVTAVGDIVYVGAGRLLALDPEDGDLLWEYGDADSYIRSATVRDGVAYLRDGSDVVAVEEGESLWSQTFDSHPRLDAITAERVFVRSGTTLHVLDAASGKDRWSVDVPDLASVALAPDRVYAAGRSLYAFDRDGTERWSEAVGDGAIARQQVVGDGDDHTVFVEVDDASIDRVSSYGDVTWSQSVEGNVKGFVVDGLVYVGTDDGVHAFDPE